MERKNEKIMLFSSELNNLPQGGRVMLSRIYFKLLNNKYKKNFIYFELKNNKIRTVKLIFLSFKGYIDGLDNISMKTAINIIKINQVSKLFVNGSNLGAFVKLVKQNLPHVEIYTFFHNVESKFFWGAFTADKSIRSLSIFIVNYISEYMSVKYSDNIITLSERDSNLLSKIYSRSASYVLPIAIEDKLPKNYSSLIRVHPENYALFVGGNFYGNLLGIRWFIKNVVPKINIKICIVGQGFDKYKDEFNIAGKVELIGQVDDMSVWYKYSSFVIAPIFEGSGMKTKVAEALMFGKKIIATDESFSGYENISNTCGWVCNTEEEFVTAILQAEINEKITFNSDLRLIYQNYYSYEATERNLNKIINSLNL